MNCQQCLIPLKTVMLLRVLISASASVHFRHYSFSKESPTKTFRTANTKTKHVLSMQNKQAGFSRSPMRILKLACSLCESLQSNLSPAFTSNVFQCQQHSVIDRCAPSLHFKQLSSSASMKTTFSNFRSFFFFFFL